MAQTGQQKGQQSGLIVVHHGRHCLLEAASGERLICHTKGKKSLGVVGDRVLWKASGDEGTVESILPRRNLLYRQDEVRTKSFAANLDCVLILIAATPEFSAHQLSRALVAAEAERITPVIVLNKSDLNVPFGRAWQRLLPYRQMGYDVQPLSLRSACDSDIQLLMERLEGKTTLVLGPSGAGKSTLINRLIPHAMALTNEVSRALQSGKHTTTCTTWYWLDDGKTSALIDSPGFQDFGLNHIDAAQLAAYMPDLRPHLAHCRFYNCSHRHEPGCAVMAAVRTDDSPTGISPSRYQIYCDLHTELCRPQRY